MTDFSELAELCEELERLSSRNAKITIVSQFLKQLDSSEIEAAVRLILGNPLASLGTRPLDVSFKTIVESIQRLTEVSDAEFMKGLLVHAGSPVFDDGREHYREKPNMCIMKLCLKPGTIKEIARIKNILSDKFKRTWL